MKSHHEMEVEVAKIIKRAKLTWDDDHYRHVRYIQSHNYKQPLTEDEKNILLKYFDLIKFPLRIVFIDFGI